MACRKIIDAPLCLPELVYTVFGETADLSLKTDGPNSVEFHYKGMVVRAEVWRDRMLGHLFGVDISDGISEYTSVATLLAYFENQKCNLYCSNDNAIRNLRTAKRFIDEGKLIFIYCDINKKKQKIVINGKTRFLPFVMPIDGKEAAKIMFGKEAKRIIDNLPVNEADEK